ncbi:MAG TPA: type II toxin-antitoxin system VapC family toxin [Kofleriaceae bacterium]|nr:type II toxin-antitoxin system VapC family toxin [Kofleriaceae bacterium]
MIVPDLNLVVYAYNRDAPHHAAARAWWEGLLNDTEPVAIPWVVVLGFLRLMTHRAVLVHPLPPTAALAHVRAWFARANVEHLEPGPQHVDLLDRLLSAAGTAGNLTTDAHLAALTIEHQCELHSNDNDFARFPGLRWKNPL